MSDPSHPIFKQFTELDPSLIVIRDAPHPDWVWSQPPALGTLTPGYTHCAPGNSFVCGPGESLSHDANGPQTRTRVQRWQPDFPGLWDDIPGSGTTATNLSSPSSGMPHTRPYPLPQSSHGSSVPSTGHLRGLTESVGCLPERQNGSRNGTGNERTVGPEHHRL
ncbi:hypothetical protein RHS04_01758 [Rhizoctonia solani]|uniref:Uncharacterized protein n=1 Tax=Rhizoctonia solani TaxID=456999 RepID=A0A8H7HDP2_9AGAM|nr:hypothetical protein RHS04_01758 [Rhizoctonia solani]